VNSEEG
jgi:YHS domain-containing protein